MGYILFDLDVQYDERTRKRAEDTEIKINDTLESLNLTSFEFFNEILPHTLGFHISSPNMNREIKERSDTETAIRNNTILKNFLFRLHLDTPATHILNNDTTIVLKGNIIINNNNPQFSYVYVTDFSLAENFGSQSYEYYQDGAAYRKIADRQEPALYNDVNLMNLELAAKIPFMTDKKEFNKFIGKWRKYLEFNKSIAIDKIESYPIAKGMLEYQPVCEIPDKAVNREEYAGEIIKEGRGNLYVDINNPRLQGDEYSYTLFSIGMDSNKFGGTENEVMKKARNFTRMELSLIGERGNNQLNKLIQAFKNNTKGTREQPIPRGIDFDNSLFPEYREKDGIVILYFLKAIESSTNPSIRQDIADLGENLYLANITTGDIALYKRGSDTLNKLEESNTRNPFLAGILSEPNKFDTGKNYYSESNVKFALENLNKSQKDAVIKCLNSSSIFLLQGPPGTGKTQTITELVYQYNKMGKKVLLSSQTHIAIDNVIERLPKDLNILPIRLVRDRSKVNRQYLPDKVLDNLYDAAYDIYNGRIDAYNRSEKEIRKLEQLFQNNKTLYETIRKRLEEVKKLEEKRNYLVKELSSLKAEENEKEADNRKLKHSLLVFNSYAEAGNRLPFESVSSELDYQPLTERLHELAKEYDIIKQDDIYNYAVAFRRIASNLRVKYLEGLLEGSEKPSDLDQVEKKIEQIKKEIDASVKLGKPAPRELIQKITNALQEKKILDRKYEASGKKIVDLSKEVFNFVPHSAKRDKKAVETELAAIKKFLGKYDNILKQVLVKGEYDKLMNEEDKLSKKDNEIEKKIRGIDVSCRKIEDDINMLNTPISEERGKLAEYYNEFYTGKLNGAALPVTDEEKFNEIKEFIEQEKIKFVKFKADYKKLEGIYESLKNYLEKSQEFIGTQRRKYTNDLLKRIANVYGMTCTSGQYFKRSDLVGVDDDVKDIEVEDLGVYNVNFDVVIIDEVSKATPIEMLIPIISGKSVVLVGDQRQLPPIFKYRENMFEGKNEDEKTRILQGETFDYFKKLVESSLFEEIYNKLRRNKAMLTEQYRFNEAIMKCVNVFYDGKLTLGAGEEQNNRKKHYLDVSIPNSRGGSISTPVFCRKNSTYWFDSQSWADGTPAYSEVQEGETSKRNALEVKLTVKMLLLLENGYGDLMRKNPEEYKLASANGKKPGVAVLTMYGKQIDSIRKEIRALDNQYKYYKNYFKNITVDIDTVDDYQGKEQDIVIVNMVANAKTRGDQRQLGEFLTKFNRINVAISRARTMLIMIGSKAYYNNVLVNVPNMDTGKENLINAYYRIFEQCESKWSAAAGIFGIEKDTKKEVSGNAYSRKN